MKLGYLPLDDRPVNRQLPADVAAIAGCRLSEPPASLLPDFREPGRPDELGAWLVDDSRDADAAAISLDMLGYGGLIASHVERSAARRAAALGRAGVPGLPRAGRGHRHACLRR